MRMNAQRTALLIAMRRADTARGRRPNPQSLFTSEPQGHQTLQPLNTRVAERVESARQALEWTNNREVGENTLYTAFMQMAIQAFCCPELHDGGTTPS